MPNLTNDDELLIGAFADLRTDVTPYVRPPGAPAARRTAHARRRAGLVTAGVLAVAGAVGVGALSPARDPESQRAGTDGPTLSQAELDDRTGEALAALGYTPLTAPTGSSGMLVQQQGVAFAGIRAGHDPIALRLGDNTHQLLVGTYMLRAACAGRGMVTMAWQTPSGKRDSVIVRCADVVNTTMYVTLTEPGAIDITLTPDAEAAGNAGFAVAVAEPNIAAAQNHLGRVPPTVVASVTGSGGQEFGSGDAPNLPAGTYQLSVACAGKGSIRVTVPHSDITDAQDVSCSAYGAVMTLFLTITQPDDDLAVNIEADKTAREQAGYAYYVSPI